MTILNITAGAHGSRSLKLREKDTQDSLRGRIADKLMLPTASEWSLKYEWIGVSYLVRPLEAARVSGPSIPWAASHFYSQAEQGRVDQRSSVELPAFVFNRYTTC